MSESSITTLDHVTEQVVIGGDLSKLTPEQRVNYYRSVCSSLGLNPLTRPFDYITLNGKLTLYARKDAAEQLRKINGISIDKPDIRFEDDWIIVTIAAVDERGRKDSDVGVVNKKDMSGNFGNALMKAITKAKRRVTLSISGLGMLDETEVETIPNVRVMPAEIPVDVEFIPEEVIPEPPFEPQMSLEAAYNVKDSDGNLYGEMDRKRLQAIDRQITLRLHKNNLSPVEKQEYQYKLDAIAVLLHQE